MLSMKKNESEIHLPDECWGQILCRLNRNQILTASLVFKQFLSVCNRFVGSLQIRGKSFDLLGVLPPKLLKRFKHVRKIIISHCLNGQQLNWIILVIACSGLDLPELQNCKPFGEQGFDWETIESMYDKLVNGLRDQLGFTMKNLRILRFTGCPTLTNKQLDFIARCFPQLEEFDDRSLYQFDDAEKSKRIDLLARNFKALRKIPYGCKLTDKGLIDLSKNCLLLSKLVTHGNTDITEEGIGFLLRNSQHLVSLKLYRMDPKLFGGLTYCAKSLSDLEFNSMNISDEVLGSISKANIPLRKLGFRSCSGFTCKGLSSLLQAYQSTITHLKLIYVSFLDDQLLIDFSACLKKLVRLIVVSNSSFTSLTLFKFIENCPLLVEMEFHEILNRTSPRTSPRTSSNTTTLVPRTKNYNIRRLQLDNKFGKNLITLAMVCPYLQELHLLYKYRCRYDTGERVEDVLKCFCNLKILSLSNMPATFFRIESDIMIPSLEELDIVFCDIDDKGLEVVAKRCPRLLKLRLDWCEKATPMGVKKVLECCRMIEEIELSGCCKNTNCFELLQETILSRPTLRKITLPTHNVPDEKLHELYLRHGCVLSITF